MEYIVFFYDSREDKYGSEIVKAMNENDAIKKFNETHPEWVMVIQVLEA